MRATDTTSCMTQFITMIRPQVDAQTDAGFLQSIQGWISYYHYLRGIRGGYSPPAVTYVREHFYGFAPALLDHIAETFCRFFELPWLWAEVPHTRLTRIFRVLGTEPQLQGDVEALHADMRD